MKKLCLFINGIAVLLATATGIIGVLGAAVLLLSQLPARTLVAAEAAGRNGPQAFGGTGSEGMKQ